MSDVSEHEPYVKTWFGESFCHLDPLIQELHLNGGTLSGPVEISVGKGIAGIIGRRLAKKLGIPLTEKNSDLRVDIHHADGCMHWNRTFKPHSEVRSVFVPHGCFPDGFWPEDTGNIRLGLGVKVIDGGWYWVQQGVWFRGIRMPLWMIPETEAYKRIENGKYVFSVSFSLPMIGMLLKYRGALDLV